MVASIPRWSGAPLGLMGTIAMIGCGFERGAAVADNPPPSGCDDPCDLRMRAYIKASNTGAGDQFGFSSALSDDGSTLVVGATGEASTATGIGGDQDDNAAPFAGAVYVYTRSGTSWGPPVYIKASNTRAGDEFGMSVALSTDGSTLAVGAPFEASGAAGIGGNQADSSAPSAGAVYLFTRRGTTWAQEAYIKASNPDTEDLFGISVALSANGSTLAVGAFFEASAATGIGGDQADNAAAFAGAAYVFTRGGTTWRQEAYIKASNTGAGDEFGASVALSGDGSSLAVGAPLEASAATGIDGNQADDSALNAGAVYVFSRSDTTWRQEAYVKAAQTSNNAQFGYRVALSADAATLAVGAPVEASAATGIDGNQADHSMPGAGAVYLFSRNATWHQEAYLKASNTGANDQFGFSVALSADGSTLAVGANGEASAAIGIDGNQADHSTPFAGAIYTFTRTDTAWNQQAYLKASNTNAADFFGSSVALSASGVLAVGAYREASAATGVGGDQANNSASFAGAVYVFR